MHLAAAMQIPLIALFGPQSPVKFGPWGDKCRVLYKNFPCSPCRQKFFKECAPSPRLSPECVESISVEEVFGSCLELAGLTSA
jgi:heptosyltransferase II